MGSSTGNCEAAAGRFSAGEWACLLAWPWVLAAAVAWAVTGEAGAREGGAAATVAGAGVAFIALVGAPLSCPMKRNSLSGLTHAERARRAGVLAMLIAAVASPAFVACAVGAPSTPGTVVVGPLLCGLSMYAFAQAAAASGSWYPAVAVLWLGAPPFAYYLRMDIIMIDRRVHDISWLFYFGPASGAMKALVGPVSAWSRLVAAALVPALVGAALALLPAGKKNAR